MKLRHFFRIRKYRTKIFVWVTFLMIVLTTVFSAVTYLNVEKIVMENEHETNQKILNQIKFNIDYINDTVKSLCLSTFYNEDIRSLMNFADEESYEEMSVISKLKNSVVASHPSVLSIYIYNNRKKTYYSTYKTFDYQDANLIKLVRSMPSVPVMKPIFRNTETYQSGDLVIYSNVLTYFMYEMTDSKNNMQGAIIVNIKLDWLINNIKSINQVSNKRLDEVFIVDENGEFIQEAKNGQDNKAFKEYIKNNYITSQADAAQGKTVQEKARIDGKSYLISSIPIEEIKWTVYKVQAYDLVFEYINKLKNTIIIITVIVFSLIFIASYTLTRGLYKPFDGLLRLAGFNGDKPGGMLEKDEFTYLNEVYRNSAEQLKQYAVEKKSNKKLIRTYFLRKLLFQSTSMTGQEFESNKREHALSIQMNKPFLIILILIDRHRAFEENNDAKTRELLKFAIINISTEILSRRFPCESIEMKNDEITLVLNTDQPSSAVYQEVAALIEEAQAKIKEHFDLSITAVLSELTHSLNELTAVYNRTAGYSVYRFVFGLGAVITPEHVKKNLLSPQRDLQSDKQKKLIELIRQGHAREAQEHFANLLSEVKKLEYNNLMLSLAYLVNSIKDAVLEMNQTRKEPINVNLFLPGNGLFELETIDEFQDRLSEVFKQLASQDEPVVSRRDMQLAEAILKIIHEAYADYNLSASGIADDLRISPTKISKLFKEHVNMSIPEYINKVRLEKAIQWMENSRLSIGEIMLKVGIENESYFYKIFKAKYGSTPREYISRSNLR